MDENYVTYVDVERVDNHDYDDTTDDDHDNNNGLAWSGLVRPGSGPGPVVHNYFVIFRFLQKFGKSCLNHIKTMQIPIETMTKTMEMSGSSCCLNIIQIAWIGCAFVKKKLYFL